jgi:hypothetical protein
MITFIKIILNIAFCTAIFFGCSMKAFTLPDGWSTIPTDGLNQEWRNIDQDHYLLVEGDFNGDYTIDKAMILASKGLDKIGLFVFLGSDVNHYEILKLDEWDYKYINVIGITTFPKGRYKEEGEPAFHKGDIIIKNDSIKYFKHDSWYGVFYWKESKKKFEYICLND